MNDKDQWNLTSFTYSDYSLLYPKIYYQFLKEQFFFDTYRSKLIKRGQIVLDLGASIGDFSIIASKKVGNTGKVIAVEPNVEDYTILKENIKRNRCINIIPVNTGVGKHRTEKEVFFWGRKFTCKLDILQDILSNIGITDRIDFVKMDVEGYEVDIIEKSIEIIEEANIISVECHNSKREIDEYLIPRGFRFIPLTPGYLIKQMIKNTVFSPRHFLTACNDTLRKNHSLLYKLPLGHNPVKDHATIVGSYIR